jgi:hypothetical protein
VTPAKQEAEQGLREKIRATLHYVVVPVAESKRRDDEFAYIVVAPRQVPRVLRMAAHPRYGFHVQRVTFMRPGTVLVYVKAGPDGWG